MAEFRQAVDAFDGLANTSAFRERAAELEKQKAVREGAKREQQEFQQQDRLTADISSELASIRNATSNRTEVRTQVERQILDLRTRSEHEKRADKSRVLRRALAGVFVDAMEEGGERLEAKQPSQAADYFELAAIADPDSVWALSSLATAKVLDGDRRGALEALRRAKSKTKDPATFSAWLNDEPAFAKLRDAVEFRRLLADQTEPR